jgi:hypothetical protein
MAHSFIMNDELRDYLGWGDKKRAVGEFFSDCSLSAKTGLKDVR